jgi:3-hydroxybutyrate dehydrogenase
LGVAIVDEFRRQGAEVLAVDLTGDECYAADISTEDGNAAAVAEALARFGRLNTLVLNAGVQHLAPIPEFALAQWDRLLGVMLTGAFLTVKAAWPELTQAPGGRVLFTASTSSYCAEPFKAAYVAAKHGLLGLAKVVALEGAAHGLTANAVAPSWMRTAMVENQVADRMRLRGMSREDVIAEIVGEQVVARFVEPTEVASTLAFLAGPAASAITGTCVPVDLGALS